MSDEPTLILLNTFILSHTRMIRGSEVITDNDLSALFEVDVSLLRELTQTNLQKFKDDSVLLISAEESDKYNKARFAFNNQGIFNLAGLIKTRRAIRIYVNLIELLVGKLQNRAYDIATNFQPKKN